MNGRVQIKFNFKKLIDALSFYLFYLILFGVIYWSYTEYHGKGSLAAYDVTSAEFYALLYPLKYFASEIYKLSTFNDVFMTLLLVSINYLLYWFVVIFLSKFNFVRKVFHRFNK